MIFDYQAWINNLKPLQGPERSNWEVGVQLLKEDWITKQNMDIWTSLTWNKKRIIFKWLDLKYLSVQDFFKKVYKVRWEALAMFLITYALSRHWKNTKCILWTFRVKKILGGYKSKIIHHKKLVFQNDVGFWYNSFCTMPSTIC